MEVRQAASWRRMSLLPTGRRDRARADLELSGKTAIVCGASSGIGLAIARALSREGANVVMTARRADLFQREALAISATAHPAELSDPPAIQQLVDATVDQFGGLDVVV